MNTYGLDFHHLGLAVANPDKAVRFLTGLGYSLEDQIYDPLQKVNLIMCRSKTMPDVEIIFSSDEPGPLQGLLKNRTELLYHLCFATKDLESSLEAIKADGNKIICVTPPQKAVLFSQRPVSFYYVAGFCLIEILQDH